MNAFFHRLLSFAVCGLVLICAHTTQAGQAGQAGQAAQSAQIRQSGQTSKPQAQTQQPSLDHMIGQMIFVGFKGMDVHAPEIQPFLASLKKGHVGGVILFDRDYLTKQPRNIASAGQVRKLIDDLQAIAPTPLFVAVDQEGGNVQRFKKEHNVTPMPSAHDMGQGKPEATYALALATGKELKAAGINMNFAPVLDVNVNPASRGLGDKKRVFSSDASIVAAHATAFTKGMQDAGLAALYKHFPGQGSATADTHYGFSDISNTWSERELEPYKDLFKKNFFAVVLTSSMFNKQLDPDYPCSLSPRVVKGLLRERLGWRGVAMSGDLQMHAISDRFGLDEAIYLALLAGQDIPLIPNNMIYNANMAEKVFTRIKQLVAEGKVSHAQIVESWQRIIALKQKLGLI